MTYVFVTKLERLTNQACQFRIVEVIERQTFLNDELRHSVLNLIKVVHKNATWHVDRSLRTTAWIVFLSTKPRYQNFQSLGGSQPK